MTPYGNINLGQHCSGNGLLPDGTKPLPEPMLTNHQWSLVAFNWGHFHGKCLRNLSLIPVWKVVIFSLQPNFPGANELTDWPLEDVAFDSKYIILKRVLVIDLLKYFLRNQLQLYATRPVWWFIYTGSGDGLVSSGTKPSHEPVLTKFYDTT